MGYQRIPFPFSSSYGGGFTSSEILLLVGPILSRSFLGNFHERFEKLRYAPLISTISCFCARESADVMHCKLFPFASLSAIERDLMIP